MDVNKIIATAEKAEEELSPAAELREAFWRLKRSRIRLSAAHTTRASSIGEPCERRLFYTRTAGELAVPHEPTLQAIFDLGRDLERYTVREIEDMGVDVMQRERDYLDRERELSAHADAKIRMPSWPRAMPLEIKGLNPYTAESIETISDLRDSRQAWVRKYYDQIQAYIHFDDAPAGVFALLNKVTGQIGFIDCPRDQERIDALLVKAERIRDAVRANDPPARLESEECARCPFMHVCLPDRPAGDGLTVLDGAVAAEASDLIARRLALAPAKSELEAIDERLKAILPGVGEVLVGDFLVKSKLIDRGGYTAPPTSYWRRSYVRIGGES